MTKRIEIGKEHLPVALGKRGSAIEQLAFLMNLEMAVTDREMTIDRILTPREVGEIAVAAWDDWHTIGLLGAVRRTNLRNVAKLAIRILTEGSNG